MKTGNILLALSLFVFTLFSFEPVNAQVEYTKEKDVNTKTLLNNRALEGEVTYEGRVGPGYGRFSSIVFDANNEGVVYAANYTRQIFKSTDAGQTWEHFYSAPQVPGNIATIDHLKFANPNEPTHLYFTVTDGLSSDVETRGLYILDVATGEVVDVIQKFNLQHLNFSDYEVDPSNPDNIVVFANMGVWYSGSKQTVWRSTDGGENFELIYDYLNYDELSVKTVNIYPGDPDRILMGLGASPGDDEGGFYGTTDGGETWNRIISGDIIGDVKMVPGDPQTIFAVTGFGADVEKILRSTDGGYNWTEMDIELTPHQLDAFVTLGIDPSNPDNVWATEENEIVVTHDGGETWESIVFDVEEYHNYYYGITVAVSPFNSDHVIIGGDHRVVETMDNGETWDLKPVKTRTMTSMDATKYPNDSTWLYYTANGSFFAHNPVTGERNEQLGLNMVNLSYYIYGDEYTQDRSFLGVPGGFSGGINVFQSYDYWAGPPTPAFSENGAKVLTHIRRAPEDEDTYWMVMPKWNPGSNALLLRTTDNFETTEEISITGTEEQIKDLEVVEGEPGVLWAYAIGENKAGVYKSTDYGDNWTQMSAGLPQGAGIWDIAVNPNNHDNLVASVSLGNGIYATYDGGETWNPAFTDFECMDVYFSENHEGVILAQKFVQAGLVISEDTGETWNQVSDDVILDASYTDTDIIEQDESIDIYMSGIGVANVKYTYTPAAPATQAIALEEGFQFVSTSVVEENPAMDVVLEDILGSDLDFVKNSNGELFHKVGFDWVNNIGDWMTKEGYLFNMNGAQELLLEGERMDATSPISLESGYQFVSYLPVEPMDATVAFESIMSDDLDFIRNSNGQTLQKIGGEWVNGIGDCQPDEGYLVKLNAAAELVYPATGNTSGITNPETEYFTFNGGNAADNVFTVYIKPGENLEEGDEVAVYDNNVLVGTTVITSDDALTNEVAAFSTLNEGNGYTTGNHITIKLYDASENTVAEADYEMINPYGDAYVNNVFPSSDGEYSVAEVNLTTTGIDEQALNLDMYPNPFKDELNISASKDLNKVSVMNAAGQIILSKENPGSELEINTNSWERGVYLIRLHTNDKVVTHKLIKK
ncbi:MAG: T9SS type A sorting domain-containing protein [Bacteroidales bacterium]|nr:T9SS type A sorting domain-containing protein [Bacteroidales bacterium]